MTRVRDALVRGRERLCAEGIESARLDARILLSQALNVAPGAVFADNTLRPEQLRDFDDLIGRRARREPLAYIAGHKEFWNFRFEVGSGVLIPRPETETLVEEALRAFPDPTAPLDILDVGTGTGCLLIAFLSERSVARGTGIDASEIALAYARANARRQGVDQRCQFFHAAWDPPTGLFDVILANPPYLSEREFAGAQPEIRDYEPREAFVAGVDGLDGMRALAPVLARRLRGNGLAFVEIGEGQADLVREIMNSRRLDVRKIVPDLSGVARCLVAGRQEHGAR